MPIPILPPLSWSVELPSVVLVVNFAMRPVVPDVWAETGEKPPGKRNAAKIVVTAAKPGGFCNERPSVELGALLYAPRSSRQLKI